MVDFQVSDTVTGMIWKYIYPAQFCLFIHFQIAAKVIGKQIQ